MNTIPRMRTINETIAEIKAIDSGSAVTPNYLRRLCKDGKVRHFYSGNKLLLDIDNLFGYLSGDCSVSA